MSHITKSNITNISLYIAKIIFFFYIIFYLVLNLLHCAVSFFSVVQLISNLGRREKRNNNVKLYYYYFTANTHLYLHLIFVRTQGSIRSRHR